MGRRSSFILRMSGAVLIAALGACRAGEPATLDVDVVGAEPDPFEVRQRLSPAGQLVRGATAEGLVALDSEGRVVPALANRWIVTDDGLSYIFRLRQGTWPDGSELTGELARRALGAAIDSVAGTALGLDLAAIRDVRAMAAGVVEIRLKRPMPDLLQLLALPEMGLLHKKLGSGPMVLSRRGAEALLIPLAPAKLGLAKSEAPGSGLRPVHLHAVPAGVAARRFGDGKVDVVLGGRFENLAIGQAFSGLTRRALRIDPVAGLFGIVFTRDSGIWAEPAMRQALSKAIDREALQRDLAPGAWTATARLFGPALSSDQNDLAESRSAAAKLVSRHVAKGGARPEVRLALPDGPGADLLFRRLSEDFAAVGVSLAKAPPGTAADFQIIDSVAVSSRTEWYLRQFSCAVRKLCSPAADALLAAAEDAPDPQKRAELLERSLSALNGSNIYIPLGTPVRWSLVRDDVIGFAPNSTGYHPLAPLARVQK